MRKINFFSPYLVRNKSGNKKATVFKAVAIAAFIIMVGSYSYTWYAIGKNNSDIQEMNAFMSAPVNLEKVTKYNETNRKLNALKQYTTILSEITLYVDKHDVIDSDVLADLNRTVPKEIFLQGTNLSMNALDIQGVSQNRTAIAEYQYNLKGLDLFKRVFITSIMGDQSAEGSKDLIFSMKCELEGGEQK